MKNRDTRINIYQDCKLIMDGTIGEILESVDVKEHPLRVAKIEELLKEGNDYVTWSEEHNDETYGLVEFDYHAALYVEVETDEQNQIFSQGLRLGKSLGKAEAIQSLQYVINDSNTLKDIDEIKMYIYNLWKATMNHDEESEDW